MAYTPLSTDFKDQILSDINTQRKYKQTVNEDGTVSLQDMTAYDQQGSSYSAKDINEERKAINDVYANKVVSLDEASLVTEPGFFCDALVANELVTKIGNDINDKFRWKKIGELAGNQAPSKTISTFDLSNRTEILLACGPAVINQTNRILSSAIIPIVRWNSATADATNGTFQSAYDGTTYLAGVSRLSDTSVKLYANSKTLCSVFAR